MGLRYRKSINAGLGFRVNISKSGVGYSWGVPGYRITKTAAGKTRRTASIPGTGISHVTESGGKKKAKGIPNTQDINVADMQEITTADVGGVTTAGLEDIANAVAKSALCNKIANWCIVFGILGIGYYPFLVAWIPAVICKFLACEKFAVSIEYEFADDLYGSYAERMSAWDEMLSSGKIWQIIQSGRPVRSRDSGGANCIVKTKKIGRPKNKLFCIKSNVELICLKLDKEALVVLPDMIMLIRGAKVGAIAMNEIKIDACSVKQIELNTPPKDTKIVGKTWMHVNGDGTADKRFKDNKQCPICLYGELDISSESGVKIQLQCSNPEKIVKFQKVEH